MGGLTVLTGDALVTSIYGTQNGNRRGRRIDGRDALVASVHTIGPTPRKLRFLRRISRHTEDTEAKGAATTLLCVL